MRRALKIAKIVFLNDLKAIWRRYSLKELVESPSFYIAIVFYAFLIANLAFVAWLRITTGTYSLDPYLPLEGWIFNFIADVLSALVLLIIFILCFVKEAPALTVPPDMEFLLYQPLHLWEIYTGLTLGAVAGFFSWMIFVILILSLFSLQWLAYIIFYLFTYVGFILGQLFIIISRILRKSGYLGIAPMVFQGYMFAGFIHSLIITYSTGIPTVSPLLSYPIKGPYVLILHLYRLIGPASLAIYLTLVFLVGLLTTSIIGKQLDINDFVSIKDVYDMKLTKKLEKVSRRDVFTSWSSPADAVRRVVLEFTVYNPRLLMRRYIPIFIVVTAAGFIARLLLLDWGIDPASIPLLVFLPVVVVYGGINFLREMLSNDLKYLWVVRVYLIDTNYFTRVLTLKYSLTLSIILFIAVGGASTLYANPALLLLPIITLPFIVLTVFALLLSASFFLRKVRSSEPASEIFKFEVLGTSIPASIPTPDPISQVLFLPSLIAFLVASLGITLVYIFILMGLVSYANLPVIIPISMASTYIVFTVTSKILSNRFSEVDINF